MQDRAAKTIGTLYYIASESQKAVKIGYATDLSMRLAGLQTGNPEKLTIRWTQRATREVERAIHNYLKPFRINREWYADDGLTCMVADDLGYELCDKAEAACLAGTDYEDAWDEVYLTLADVRRVLPGLVKDHAAWIAAGRPEDPEEAQYNATIEALDAANELPA